MKTTFRILALCSAVFLCMFTSCEEKKKEKNDENTENTASKATSQTTYTLASAETTDDPCDCSADWFPHSQTPAPAEGKGSPFDKSETTNCIFHQWSWQKFLWLTSPQGSKGTPLFLDQVQQIDPFMNPVTVASGTSLTLSSEEAEQAGSSGILTSNPNFNTSGTSGKVYYAIFMNDIMQNAAKKYAAQINANKLPADNTAAFPVGSFELKTSWISTDVIPSADRENYFITNANVDGTTTEVAMLGMHVVGIVENHPEFIWATFEHNSLAPAFNWEEGTASTDTETLLFKKGSTSTIDGIYWNSKTKEPNAASEAYILFEYGVPRVQSAPDSGSNFMLTSQQEPLNYNNIVNINECVAGKLSDVWNNYAYSGSIWVNTDEMTSAQQIAMIKEQGFNLGKATKGSVARGSLNSANISMETYTQTFQKDLSSIEADNLANCLSCHNATSFSTGNPTSPLYISHVFNGYLEHQKGTEKEEINAMKVKDFQDTYFEKE